MSFAKLMQTGDNILGFDFGTKYIGVALANLHINNARPLTTIERKSNKYYWQQITKLIDQWQPTILVVGEPLTLAGNIQPMTQLAAKFTRQLQARFKVQVFQTDERLTSRLAQTTIKDNEQTMSKQLIDKIAAQIILQTWLDSNGQ